MLQKKGSIAPQKTDEQLSAELVKKAKILFAEDKFSDALDTIVKAEKKYANLDIPELKQKILNAIELQNAEDVKSFDPERMTDTQKEYYATIIFEPFYHATGTF